MSDVPNSGTTLKKNSKTFCNTPSSSKSLRFYILCNIHSVTPSTHTYCVSTVCYVEETKE